MFGFDLIDAWGPEKVVVVSDARTQMKGVLVIDNTALGMGKGGTRLAPSVSIASTARLARAMTLKWAALGLGFGGAKAGIRSEGHPSDREAVLRAFARKLSNEVPAEYVFGLDMGLREEDAAVLRDEIGDQGASVGLPTVLGGYPYDELGVTGFGVAEAAQASQESLGTSLDGKTIAIQGFGAVGRAAARRLDELGARICGVSTASGGIWNKDGLDVALMIERASDEGDDFVLSWPGGERTSGDAVLAGAVDVLIPAAREDTITAANQRDIQASVIVEAANLAVTAEARVLLEGRGVHLVPDFIANAGGVIAAAHSMDVRYSPFGVDSNAVFAMVSEKMRTNTTTVLEGASSNGSSSYEVAQQIARDRVNEAMRVRGMAKA